LLPGVLMRNQSLKFIDQWEELEVQTNNSPWLNQVGKKIKLPIAHGDGRFYAPESDLKEIQDRGQIALTYTDNPNGSCYNMAGVSNINGNVLGVMSHPVHALYDWMGDDIGRGFFQWV